MLLPLLLAVGGLALGAVLGRRFAPRRAPEAPPHAALPRRRRSGQLGGRAESLMTAAPMTATIEQALPSHLRHDVQASVERAEAQADLIFLDGFLEDIRDQVGADEAVFWQLEEPVGDAPATGESIGEIFATAWSTADSDRPAHFRVEEWGPLVRWAAESGSVQTGGEGDHPPLVAAPVRSGDSLVGVLSVSREAGVRVTRGEARQWLPRHATRIGALLELFSVRRDYGRSMRQGQALFGAVERIHRHASPDALGQELCSTAVEVTSATASALVRWQPAEKVGDVRHVYGQIGAPTGLALDPEGIVAQACEEGASVVIEDATHLRRGAVFGPGDRFEAPGTVAVIPVAQRGRAIGALVIAGPQPGSISREEAQNLRLLAAVAATALEIAWDAAEVAQRALTDGLTGLGNRRYFDDELKRMLDETDRFGRSSTLVLVDLDHFKQVNDTYGHEAGDAVLRQVARILQEGVRTVDRVSRYGGEELALLLPQTPADGAAELAERLRKRIEGHPVMHRGAEIPVTASFGIASYPEVSRTKQGLFPAADAALYEAKAAGRNCVRVAQRSGEPKLT